MFLLFYLNMINSLIFSAQRKTDIAGLNSSFLLNNSSINSVVMNLFWTHALQITFFYVNKVDGSALFPVNLNNV